jgi:CDP-diacylglycerol--glycerol-3-phosphate 3-phosphatidyltransferase
MIITMKTMRILHAVPISLTLSRIALAPLMVWLALYHPSQVAFAGCLIAAFLSDLFDGIIARRLGIATPTLRRLDSIADSIFYIATMYAAWHLYAAQIRAYIPALLLLAGVEGIRYVFDWLKYRRETSYHMWSSKLWGIFLFITFFNILVYGQTGIWTLLAIYTGIVADIEGLVISALLPTWRNDVPTVFHALKLRATG